MDIQFIERLERELEEDLPGRDAQFLMAPIERQQEFEIPDNHILACVVALIFPKKKDWNVVLIERVNDNPNDHHAGQLSFPGGRFEDTDYSYQDCALREAEEEIGINASEVGIIGELSSIYIPVSNYLIYPFVGFMGDEPEFTIQRNEVQQIHIVPLKHFLEGRNKKRTDMDIRGRMIKDVPFYEVNNMPLWGATAMIMSELEHLIRKVI
ncbi:MAG: CoA pyrophosphatase [Saprospiraceae bacterium]|nr:CoA pyrophosphatase [Saprospiraceae bacterium]